MTSINKLRERVGIYEVTQGQPDGIGGYQTAKTLAITVWARVQQTRGSRGQEGQAMESDKPYTVTMRTGSYALTTENILNWNSKDLTIQSIAVDELKRMTTAECNE